MGKTKKELRFFNVTQYNQEEEYLSSMHRKGWKFTKVYFPGVYCFEECKPENVTYRMDYNQEGIRNKAEYVQMFSDCGWEYLMDFAGYSYFRKTISESDSNDEIFCDDESKLDMMKRVYKGRIVPLIVLFCGTIIPQFMMNAHGYGGGNQIQDVLALFFMVLGILYILNFWVFTISFHNYEKSIRPEDKTSKLKYAAIYAVLIACGLVFVIVTYFRVTSKYTISDRDNGFVIEAERLNRKVTK